MTRFPGARAGSLPIALLPWRMAWLLAALLLALPSLAEPTVLETVTLAPQEKKVVRVESDQKLKLGWRHKNDGVASECQKMCVMMTKQGSANGYASMHGAAMGIQPIDGAVQATLENVEAFPIEIEIYTKAP